MEKGTINWGVTDLGMEVIIGRVVVTPSQAALTTEVNNMEDMAAQAAMAISQAMVVEEAMITMQVMVGIIQAAMAMSPAMVVKVAMGTIQGMVGVTERGTEGLCM